MNEFTHRCHSQKNQFTILLIGYLVAISQCWFFLISGINHVKQPSDIIWFLATLFWFIVIFPATGAINIWGIIFTVNTVKFNAYINKNKTLTDAQEYTKAQALRTKSIVLAIFTLSTFLFGIISYATWA